MKNALLALGLALIAMTATPAEAITIGRWEIVVLNDTSEHIAAVQASSIVSPNWGPDRLGTRGIIRAGSHWLVDFTNPEGDCRVDIKFTFVGANPLVLKGYNVCANDVIQLSDTRD